MCCCISAVGGYDQLLAMQWEIRLPLFLARVVGVNTDKSIRQPPLPFNHPIRRDVALPQLCWCTEEDLYALTSLLSILLRCGNELCH